MTEQAMERAVVVLDPALVDAGRRHLAGADPILAAAIDQIGPCRLEPEPDLLGALLDGIVSQQLSIKAAAAIVQRLTGLIGTNGGRVQRLRAAADDELRAVGLSRAKVLAVRDLADRLLDGRLVLEELSTLEDDAVVARLAAVRGIGRWTAEMVLIFSLNRADVWPVDDLGIATAVEGLYALPARPTRKELLAMGEPWRPYRTVASWYLWQSRRIVLGRPW